MFMACQRLSEKVGTPAECSAWQVTTHKAVHHSTLLPQKSGQAWSGFNEFALTKCSSLGTLLTRHSNKMFFLTPTLLTRHVFCPGGWKP